MHGVFGDVFGLDRLESARADVQRHAGGVHTPRCQGGQHAFVKMQCRRGRGHCAGCAGKDGLVTLFVFFGVGVFGRARRALNVRRQGHHAVLFHQGMGLIAQLQVKQLAIFIGPAAQQHRIKTALVCAACQVHLAAQQRFFAHLHVRHHLVALQHPLDQQFQLAA